FALQSGIDHRILAAMAHHAVAISSRLSLYSARRQSARRATPLSQSNGDDAARRTLARGGLEFSGMGRPARTLSLRQSFVAGVAQIFKDAVRAGTRASSILGDDIPCRRVRMGFLPCQNHGCGMA